MKQKLRWFFTNKLRTSFSVDKLRILEQTCYGWKNCPHKESHCFWLRNQWRKYHRQRCNQIRFEFLRRKQEGYSLMTFARWKIAIKRVHVSHTCTSFNWRILTSRVARLWSDGRFQMDDVMQIALPVSPGHGNGSWRRISHCLRGILTLEGPGSRGIVWDRNGHSTKSFSSTQTTKSHLESGKKTGIFSDERPCSEAQGNVLTKPTSPFRRDDKVVVPLVVGKE